MFGCLIITELSVNLRSQCTGKQNMASFYFKCIIIFRYVLRIAVDKHCKSLVLSLVTFSVDLSKLVDNLFDK
jgi:hypothetical protein